MLLLLLLLGGDVVTTLGWFLGPRKSPRGHEESLGGEEVAVLGPFCGGSRRVRAVGAELVVVAVAIVVEHWGDGEGHQASRGSGAAGARLEKERRTKLIKRYRVPFFTIIFKMTLNCTYPFAS